MFRIESKVDTASAGIKENRSRMQAVVDEFRTNLSRIREGGPEKYRELHKNRGKLLDIFD